MRHVESSKTAKDTSLSSSDLSTFDDSYDNDQIVLNIEELGQAVVTDTDWTTETILNQIKRGNFKLNPSFQRRDAWDSKRKSRFVESLMLGLPIPQLVLAEAKDRKGTFLVLDGKQRLLALQQFATGSSLDTGTGDGTVGFSLKNLEVLERLNGKSLADIEEDVLDDWVVDSFLNQTIRTVVVRNWPNEDYLHTVFLRLNTGSVQLSPQELRQALHPGPFTAFLDSFSADCEPLQRALGNTKPDFRMRDVELTLRYFAVDYYLESYQGNLKKFLDETVERLNSKWEKHQLEIEYRAHELEDAIRATVEVFGADAFRSWSKEKTDFQGRFNRAVFDIMVFYFKEEGIRTIAMAEKGRVKNAFIELAKEDQEFLDSISSTTKTAAAFATRIGKWGSTLNRVLDEVDVTVPRLVNNRIVVE